MRFAAMMVLALVALVGCRKREHVGIITGEAMGTTYRIKVVGRPDGIEARLAEMLDRLDRELSTWRADSWVSEFNRAPAGASFEMPAATAGLLELAQACHVETDGRFDPTIGGLIRLWGFGAWSREWHEEPSAEEITAAREASGFKNLRIEGRQITKLHGGLMFDFSGIAKGYAVDRMGEILRDAGCRDFIIEFGGDLLANGNAPGRRGWVVDGPAFDQPVTLRNEAVATSGSEHRFRGGHSHVIDPRSGRPVAVGPAVSATAPTCAEADALATARLVEHQKEIRN